MELQKILKEELKTAYRLMGIMKPKSEAEFIAVVLPNLHMKIHELLTNKQLMIAYQLKHKLKTN